RSVFERWRAEGGYAAGVHLQHGRKSLGSAEVVAACVRNLRQQIETVVSHGELWFVVHGAGECGFEWECEGMRRRRVRASQGGAGSCRGGCASRMARPGGDGW